MSSAYDCEAVAIADAEVSAIVCSEVNTTFLSDDPQGPAIRYDHTGIVQAHEAADLSDERQAVRSLNCEIIRTLAHSSEFGAE